MSKPFPLPLDAPAVALPISPGTSIVLHGSVVSRFDGVELDAATSRWPASAPGGGSLDPRGLVDFEAGGLEVIRLDAQKHEVEAVGTPGAVAPLCARYGTTTPCLVLRTRSLAHGRMLTEKEWLASLRGGLRVELDGQAAAVAASSIAEGALGTALRAVSLSFASVLVLALLALLAVRVRRATEPTRRLARLVRSVRKAAAAADPVLAQLLSPALQGAARAVRGRHVDPASAEGRRLARALEELHAALRDRASHRQQEAERRVVDELAFDVQIALDAAAEASTSS